MKSTAKTSKLGKSRTVAAKRGRTVVIDGVEIQIPRVPGKPKYHTEQEIRQAVRDYFKALKTA